jgi:hypothetical protein
LVDLGVDGRKIVRQNFAKRDIITGGYSWFVTLTCGWPLRSTTVTVLFHKCGEFLEHPSN